MHLQYSNIVAGLSGGSAGKESACNAGDLGSIPGLGRSPGEGKGYPLQYSGLENPMECIVHGVAKSRTQLSGQHCTDQLGKNSPATWKIWVQSLGWEDSLEKEKATHSSILVWRIPGLYSPSCRKKSWTHLSNFHFQVLIARV